MKSKNLLTVEDEVEENNSDDSDMFDFEHSDYEMNKDVASDGNEDDDLI